MEARVFSRRFAVVAGGAAAAFALLSCSAETTVPTEFGDILFLASAEPATVHMGALWDGTISADAAGCLRLDGPERHTVVWPYGFQLRMRPVLDRRRNLAVTASHWSLQ